jgi:cell division protein FtsQ
VSDDPRDTAAGPEAPRAGNVTTASPPSPSPSPSPRPPEEEPEITVEDAEIRVEPEAVPEAVPVPADEAETVELALSDLHEAARAAGVEIPPNVDQPDPEPDALDPADPEPAAPELGDGEAGTGRIDPRIRERRIAITRAQGRRRLRIMLAAVAIASVIGIAWLIVMSPFLAVDDVTIQGTLHESPESVRAAAGVSDGAALLFVDTGAVARRIEKLPWIAAAKVDREFPTGLRITVVERSPAAWVRRPRPAGSPSGAEGPAALVDATGRVLGDELTPPVGLPEIEGTKRLGAPGSRISPARPALALALLPFALRAQVASLTRQNGEPVLVLAAPPGGADPAATEVRLGRLEDVMAKGAAALAVLQQLTADEARVSYIDVRVPGAPATR